MCLWLDSASCSVEGAGAGVRWLRMRNGRGWRTEDRRSLSMGGDVLSAYSSGRDWDIRSSLEVLSLGAGF